MFDLNAFVKEQEGEPFRFRFGDHDYELPPHMDMRAVASLSAGRIDEALRVMLGKDQWDQLLAEDVVFDDRALLALMTAHAAHAGTTLPESSASTGS